MRTTGPNAKTRELIFERDGWRCRRCGSADGPFAIHHRRPRGMGGTKRADANSPANLLLLDEDCHAWTESHRALARFQGLLVGQAADPADVLVLLADGWAWLDGDGTVRFAGAA